MWCLTLCFFISTSNLLTAQLCNGNLGDPIVNYSFPDGVTELPVNSTVFLMFAGALNLVRLCKMMNPYCVFTLTGIKKSFDIISF